MTGEELAALDHTSFMAMFSDVFEHSAWIAEAAWQQAPFQSMEALLRAMIAALDAAGPEAGIALVRAHPDLAGKAALAGDLTADSTAEQKASGLASLTPDELGMFHYLNTTYREKFGFPFVMAVRKATKREIIAAFEARIANDPQTELVRALDEIKTIAWLRLEAIAAKPA